MTKSLGKSIKQIRKEKHLSQKELSNQICSQSMLSSIENDLYTPNALLLIKLCEKLSINLSQISLSDNFEISNDESFNQTLSKLCNHHQYPELKNFLLNENTINQINTDEQTQSYYYYLGIAYFQSDKNSSEAKINLTMALSIKSNPVLNRLVVASLSLVLSTSKPNEAKEYLEKATSNLNSLNYAENLNIIFYLAAFINLKFHQFETAINWINDGITFITKHNSHYMLANCYYLLSRINLYYTELASKDYNLDKSEFLGHLFDEKIFTGF